MKKSRTILESVVEIQQDYQAITHWNVVCDTGFV